MEEIFSFNSSTEIGVCVSSSYGMKLRRKARVATGPRNLLLGTIIILERDARLGKKKKAGERERVLAKQFLCCTSKQKDGTLRPILDIKHEGNKVSM